MRSVLAAAALCAFAACSPSTPPPAPKAAPPAEPTAADFRARFAAAIASATADKSTPDAALRSWWAAGDTLRRINCDAFPYAHRASEPWSKAWVQSLGDIHRATLTGDAAASFDQVASRQENRECIRHSFDRVIESTRYDGSDKVVVTVLTHNTTPLPDGLKLAEIRSRQRQGGGRYRYTLLKREDGWRISAVESNQYPYYFGWVSLTRPRLEFEGAAYSETEP